MGRCAGTVVEELMAAWARQDVEGTLEHCADRIHHTNYDIDGDGTGESRIVGKAELRAHLISVRETWQFIYLGHTVLVARGNNVRGQVLFLSVHRKTGLRYSGTKRFEWHVEHGLVRKSAKYHDALGLKAFLAMAHSS
jgi:ketosteroid isomerase-like protein